jgi:hypothetical protein
MDSCDFCRAVPTLRGYLCSNFSLNGIPVFSNASGMWMACQQCAELVNAGEWSALVERAYKSFAARYGVVPVNAVRAQFSELVTQFAGHWKIES